MALPAKGCSVPQCPYMNGDLTWVPLGRINSFPDSFPGNEQQEPRRQVRGGIIHFRVSHRPFLTLYLIQFLWTNPRLSPVKRHICPSVVVLLPPAYTLAHHPLATPPAPSLSHTVALPLKSICSRLHHPYQRSTAYRLPPQVMLSRRHYVPASALGRYLREPETVHWAPR